MSTILVGTTKGLFTVDESGAIAGPAFPGEAVYAVLARGRTRLASTAHGHFGAVIRRSDDGGASWSTPESAPVRFPDGSGVSLEQIWQLETGRGDDRDTLYCGVAPAALFVSRDGGATFELNRGLFDHPQRPKWQPGGGGLALHTISPHPTDPKRMIVAISTGGVYATEDGGASWEPRNRGVRAEFLPDKQPEFGQCVHKVVRHPSRPERLFLQNHWGLYRSDDEARSWQDVARGVPSDFGFCMAIHPRDPDTVFIVPLHSDGFRCTPEGRLRVYRTRDAGESWEPLERGLPQEHAWETVLRDAMGTDSSTGIYFGTRSGKLYGSRDGGDRWERLADGLPPITCVRAASIEA